MLHRLLMIMLVVAIATAPVHAQQVPWVALDVSVGSGHGFGGPKTDDRGIHVIAVNLSMAVHRRANSAILLSTGIDSHGASIWQRVCDPTPPGHCQDYPAWSSRVLMLGYARAISTGRVVRVLAGLARVTPGRTVPGGTRGVGGVVHADWSTPVTPHMDVLLFGRAAVAPRWESRRYGTIAVGVGLRSRPTDR